MNLIWRRANRLHFAELPLKQKIGATNLLTSVAAKRCHWERLMWQYVHRPCGIYEAKRSQCHLLAAIVNNRFGAPIRSNQRILWSFLFNFVTIHHPTQNLHLSPPGGADTDKENSCAQLVCLFYGSKPSSGHSWNWRFGNLHVYKK